MSSPPADNGAVASGGYTEGYDVGQREGARLALDVHADALEATAMRLAAMPDAVSALNEATALLRDAALSVTNADPPPAGVALDRRAGTSPRPEAPQQRQGKRRRKVDDAEA